MRVLLVEPEYRRGSQSFLKKVLEGKSKKRDEETLWYPPLGLMKLSTFHKRRGDEVHFAIGKDPSVLPQDDLFTTDKIWDRVYITTLFTFEWDKVIDTINFYKDAVGGSVNKIFVGGIMASLMPEDLFAATNIYPIVGILDSPQKIRLSGTDKIDLLPPDYSLISSDIYAINDTYYAYTTRGCSNKCSWCGVPTIEDKFNSYIDIKPTMIELRELYGDKSRLKLMDNNVLASSSLPQIVNDLLELGYGRGETTKSDSPRTRVIDFNQGLDATHFTEENISLLSSLNIRPMRIAFDRLSEKEDYIKAIKLAYKYGFTDFSNYMLYNWNDTPRDLFERLVINIELNSEFANGGAIYSYPMRFAPIFDKNGKGSNKKRDYFRTDKHDCYDYLSDAKWNRRFVRNIEVIKGATHGAISPTISLAKRAIGHTYEQFIANLYMPEELLRNRNKYEREVREGEPPREPGDGTIEEFYDFIFTLLRNQDERFRFFHKAVSQNTVLAIKKALHNCEDKEVKKWLEFYLKK